MTLLDPGEVLVCDRVFSVLADQEGTHVRLGGRLRWRDPEGDYQPLDWLYPPDGFFVGITETGPDASLTLKTETGDVWRFRWDPAATMNESARLELLQRAPWPGWPSNT